MERQAVGEDRVETSLDQHDETRLQRYALLAREVGRMAGATQQTLHLVRPVLSFDLDRRLQFAPDDETAAEDLRWLPVRPRRS
jgi:hypothetical protein